MTLYFRFWTGPVYVDQYVDKIKMCPFIIEVKAGTEHAYGLARADNHDDLFDKISAVLGWKPDLYTEKRNERSISL